MSEETAGEDTQETAQDDTAQDDTAQKDSAGQSEGQSEEGQQSEGRSDEGRSQDEQSQDEQSQDEQAQDEQAGTGHAPGTPAWAELGTTDARAAAAFYSGLFGWQAENTPAGAAGTYVLLQKDGQDVAALYEQDEAMRSRGVPPLWLVYFSVEDVSAAAAKAQEAGGTLHAQPFDVAQAGRMALVQDPTGAMFALWQPGSRVGAQVLHEPGTLDWFELATSDPEKAGEFYEQVLGWSVNADEFDGTPYTTCLLGEQPVAGILPAEALGEGVAPNWSVYFAVEDCDAAVEQAQQAGAELLSGPHEMPRVGKFAGLRDPQGAAFAVIQQQAGEDASSEEESDEESESGEKSGSGERAESDEKSESGTHPQDGDQGDDAQSDGKSADKGEPNEELREKNTDSGAAQADGSEDDDGVR